jgi:hypothetical protein
VGRFTAPNPWNQGARTEWTLNVYFILNEAFGTPETASRLKPNRLYRPEVIGICSESDGRYHLLPRSLSNLWKKNQVPNERLPELLKAIEPKLRDGDFWHPFKDITSAILTFLLASLSLMPLTLYFLSNGRDFHDPQNLWAAALFALFPLKFLAVRLSRRFRCRRQTTELLRRLAGVG